MKVTKAYRGFYITTGHEPNGFRVIIQANPASNNLLFDLVSPSLADLIDKAREWIDNRLASRMRHSV